jgi:hypothetical protein
MFAITTLEYYHIFFVIQLNYDIHENRVENTPYSADKSPFTGGANGSMLLQ